MEAQQITYTSPLRGLGVNQARFSQSTEFTADCSNVLPYDRSFRMRVSMRPGTNTGTYTARGTGASPTCFVQGPSTLYFVKGAANAGYGKGKVYYINGGVVKEDAGSLAATTAVAVPTTYALATIWRNRLVLAGADHKWIMSHVDDYGNFDTADTTVARAIAGTNAIYSTPGAIMDNIVSLIPWNDDVLIIACDHTMWAIKGDPAYGGSINLLNNGVGILAPNAWSIDPSGTLWMIGTGGVYKFNGGIFQLASEESYTAYFQAITRSTTAVTCAWDRDRHGLWIFRSNNTGLFYDERKQGFWPITTVFGVQAAYVFDGPNPADRFIHIGTADDGGIGTVVVHKLDSTRTTDKTVIGGDTPITAYVQIGPIMPAGANDEVKVIQLDIVQGETAAGFDYTNMAADWTLLGGTSPYDALYSAAETRTGTITPTGAQKRSILGVRMKATCFFLKLATAAAANTFFAFESANFHFLPGGRGRN